MKITLLFSTFESDRRGVTEPVVWLRDNRHIIRSDSKRIAMVDAPTKKMSDLFSNPDVEICSPFVSPDSKLLYYTTGNNKSDF